MFTQLLPRLPAYKRMAYSSGKNGFQHVAEVRFLFVNCAMYSPHYVVANPQTVRYVLYYAYSYSIVKL